MSQIKHAESKKGRTLGRGETEGSIMKLLLRGDEELYEDGCFKGHESIRRR
jgi:hypothetical protein